MKNKSIINIILAYLLAIAQITMASETEGSLKKINLSEVYETIISTHHEIIIYDGVEIIDDISSQPRFNEYDSYLDAVIATIGIDFEVYPEKFTSKANTLILSNSSADELTLAHIDIPNIKIYDSQFSTLNLSYLKVDSLHLEGLNIAEDFNLLKTVVKDFYVNNDTLNSLSIDGVHFLDYAYFGYSSYADFAEISHSIFENGAFINMDLDGIYQDFFISNCIFEPIKSNLIFSNDTLLEEPKAFKTQFHFNLFGDLDQLIIESCTFLASDPEQLIFIEGTFDFLLINNNKIESVLYPACTVNKQFSYQDNTHLNAIVMVEFFLEGINNIIDWNSLKGNKIIGAKYPGFEVTIDADLFGYPDSMKSEILKQTSDVNFIFFRGENPKELQNDVLMQELISSYYRFYKAFKNNGQIAIANDVYIEMKDHELNRLAYKFDSEGGIDNYFQWKLSQLLRFYTSYGTNPSRAIVVSIFVILGFSIFYFFFPSEWDTQSKRNLIDDYQIFIRKNEYGYFRPLFILLWGFILSMINALTLSLNSFVTLGFGSIPAKGLAKYVCIIEGFLGWFLLSIFTASLINQVMF